MPTLPGIVVSLQTSGAHRVCVARRFVGDVGHNRRQRLQLKHVRIAAFHPSALPKRAVTALGRSCGGRHPYASLWTGRSRSGSVVTYERTLYRGEVAW